MRRVDWCAVPRRSANALVPVTDVRVADPCPLAEELHPIVEPLRDADEVDTCQQARRSGIHGVVADVFERRRDPSAGGDAPALEVGERAHEAEHVARSGCIGNARESSGHTPHRVVLVPLQGRVGNGGSRSTVQTTAAARERVRPHPAASRGMCTASPVSSPESGQWNSSRSASARRPLCGLRATSRSGGGACGW